MNLPETGWLSIRELSDLMGVTTRALKKRCSARRFGDYQRVVRGNGGEQYQVHAYSPELPLSVKERIIGQASPIIQAPVSDISVDADIISSAKAHERRKFNKYIQILGLSEGISGGALQRWVGEWNAAHPDQKTSWQSIMRERKRLKEEGPAALLGQWGKSAGSSKVPDSFFEYFKGLYLKEGGPGVMSCWKITLGWAQSQNPGLTISHFPSHMAFHRKLQNEMLPEVVFRARNGAKASFRKHGFHIKRNYDETPAGMIWVSDHAQIDIACSYTDETGRERYTFPWVTAWRDFKSGKWMGWEVYPGNPNSDHIFAAMYIGMEEHGIPMMAYLDNGKDYRSKDFSGGRSTIRVSVDEFHTRSLLGQLQIEPIFAWPYNPQSKPIERDFLRNKEWLSKHAKGYRGGNVVERPEGLNARVAAGDIESIDELRKTFDVFISEVVNKSAVSSGHRAGMCPNEIWDAEVAQTVALGGLKRVSKDALKLFCSRTSGDICIRGRGVRDSVLGIDYYDHWMLAFKGRKVYMRRDPRRYEEAWVFDSATNECLGKGFLLAEAPAMARTDVQREQLAQAIATKRRTEKIIKSYAQKPEDEVPLAEKIEYMAAATALINKERGYTPTEQQLQSNTTMVTQMDHVLAEQKRRDEIGKQDYGTSLPPEGKGDYDEIDPWQAYAAG